MDQHIQGLIQSVISGRKFGKPDFTRDLPETFVCSTLPPRQEWARYVEYRKAVDLRNARNKFLWDHHDPETLAEDFMLAYYDAAELHKKFK